jgi:ABC-type amino acid transport system permease subunit
MNFGIQMILALLITCVIGIPITLHKYKQYRKEGKSVKYLEFKVAIAVGMPIMTIPILLSAMTVIWKVIALIAMLLSGIAYAYSVTSARKAFRKMVGLPPEDEDTGEIIKGDDKQKDE